MNELLRVKHVNGRIEEMTAEQLRTRHAPILGDMRVEVELDGKKRWLRASHLAEHDTDVIEEPDGEIVVRIS